MECTLTGRSVAINPELRELISRRLDPLERLLGDAIVSADMVLTSERHLCVSELIVHARGEHRLHGLAQGPSWHTAVGAAVDKVMHQAQTLKGKWHGRRRQPAPRAGDDAEGPESGDSETSAG